MWSDCVNLESRGYEDVLSINRSFLKGRLALHHREVLNKEGSSQEPDLFSNVTRLIDREI